MGRIKLKRKTFVTTEESNSNSHNNQEVVHEKPIYTVLAHNDPYADIEFASSITAGTTPSNGKHTTINSTTSSITSHHISPPVKYEDTPTSFNLLPSTPVLSNSISNLPLTAHTDTCDTIKCTHKRQKRDETFSTSPFSSTSASLPAFPFCLHDNETCTCPIPTNTISDAFRTARMNALERRCAARMQQGDPLPHDRVFQEVIEEDEHLLRVHCEGGIPFPLLSPSKQSRKPTASSHWRSVLTTMSDLSPHFDILDKAGEGSFSIVVAAKSHDVGMSYGYRYVALKRYRVTTSV